MWFHDRHQAALDKLDLLRAEADLRRLTHRPHAAARWLLGVVRRLESCLAKRLADEPTPISKPNRA